MQTQRLWRPPGEFELDADRQVQDVVRLIFDKFDDLGTIGAVLRHLVHHGIRIGVRPQSGPNRGQVEWRAANRYTLHDILRNPTYAGTYTHGRRPVDPRRKVPGRPATGRTTRGQADWEVLILDHLPAYITWDRYLADRRRLADNQARRAAKGAPRRGAALLTGLIVCGRCGLRLTVGYAKGGRPFYVCHHQASNYGGPLCRRVAATPVDDLVGGLVLRAVEPVAMDLALQAADDPGHERDRLERHWRQRLERARFEADRAARQYRAVDPENRLVAAELERRWEQALLEQRQVKEDHERFTREWPGALTDGDRELIRSLAADLPRLWHAGTTTMVDRKTIIRHLVERIVVQVRGTSEFVEASIQWVGGAVSHHEVRRPVHSYEHIYNFSLLKDRVAALRRAGRTAGQIAEALNDEGFVPPRGPGRYDRDLVRQLVYRRGISREPRRELQGGVEPGPDEWWLTTLADELGISQKTLGGWASRGWIRCRKIATGLRRWVVWADAAELDRLRRLSAYRPKGGRSGPIPADPTTPGPEAVAGASPDGVRSVSEAKA